MNRKVVFQSYIIGFDVKLCWPTVHGKCDCSFLGQALLVRSPILLADREWLKNLFLSVEDGVGVWNMKLICELQWFSGFETILKTLEMSISVDTRFLEKESDEQRSGDVWGLVFLFWRVDPVENTFPFEALYHFQGMLNFESVEFSSSYSKAMKLGKKRIIVGLPSGVGVSLRSLPRSLWELGWKQLSKIMRDCGS